MIPGSAKTILIAPLDWGLGHTTRCVPIIRHLLAQKCRVIFAGNDRQQTFIAHIFPHISFENLPGYSVRYSSRHLTTGLIAQLPRLHRVIRSEHSWLLRLAAAERIDGIISDNRYGLWHPGIPSVILTHQAQIRTGAGNWADHLVRRAHYTYLARFDACWLVDRPGNDNLGGTLSHPGTLPRKARYVGWLSQFERSSGSPVHKNHLLVLLSGPEPHRTALADMLWDGACRLNIPVVFIEGEASARRSAIPAHITHYPLVAGEALQRLLEGASLVVCRSGYSTLMDLILLQLNAILIPTPGQTEQEYLAKYMMERKVFFAAPQQGFDLIKAMEQATVYPAAALPGDVVNTEFGETLQQWVQSL